MSLLFPSEHQRNGQRSWEQHRLRRHNVSVLTAVLPDRSTLRWNICLVHGWRKNRDMSPVFSEHMFVCSACRVHDVSL
jgi:hypothetical protein